MPVARRWILVVLGTAALVVLPSLVALRPAGHSSLSATAVLAKIRASGGRSYSGYAESVGGLGLPVTSQFNSIADLLGGNTEMRVWWRSPLDWRVDTQSAFGESDVHRDATGTWTWSYEGLRASRVDIATEPTIRLPRSTDLLPPELARRLLSQADPSEVSRLPVRRVAGVDAVGLLLRPSQPGSSITRVEVWADAGTGLALRVDVFGASDLSAVSTSFLDFSSAEPSARTTAFTAPPSARLSSSDGRDLASQIDTFAPVRPPASLAGLPRAARTDLGAVGVYGRGVTELVAVPLWDRLARSLQTQLTAAGATVTGSRQELAVGPVSMLLQSDVSGGTSWLLTGTVTPQTLRTAAAEIVSNPPGRTS